MKICSKGGLICLSTFYEEVYPTTVRVFSLVTKSKSIYEKSHEVFDVT